MITVLEYLIVAAVIGAVVFAIVVLVFGRGEQMAPLSPRTSPAELPDANIGGADVRAVKFAMAVRGYRMSDVDWVLDRLAARIDDLEAENAALHGPPGTPAGGHAPEFGPPDSQSSFADPGSAAAPRVSGRTGEMAGSAAFSGTPTAWAAPAGVPGEHAVASETRPSIDSDTR